MSTNKVPPLIIVCEVVVLEALPKAELELILTKPSFIVVIPE